MLEIAKRVGISRPMVWRWQQRFAEEVGIEGRLLRDKTSSASAFRQCRRPQSACRGRAHLARTARCSHPLDRPRELFGKSVIGAGRRPWPRLMGLSPRERSSSRHPDRIRDWPISPAAPRSGAAELQVDSNDPDFVVDF